VDFLTKPFSEADLMGAIHTALAQDREARLERQAGHAAAAIIDLTPRDARSCPRCERPAEQASAAELGISEVTSRFIAARSCTDGGRSFAELCGWPNAGHSVTTAADAALNGPLIETCDGDGPDRLLVSAMRFLANLHQLSDWVSCPADRVG